MTEPWNFTEAQRRQFREAQAEAKQNRKPRKRRPEMPDAPEAQFKVIETDGMTGWDRYLDNMGTSPWTGTFTREQAEATVKWREENITGRYRYEIVPVEPHMTDNDKARERHDNRTGRHSWKPMEDCADIDCREADRRLFAEQTRRELGIADPKTTEDKEP